MRITTGMITDRVVFNMQRSLGRLIQMQTEMSSGRRINKPSDDPLGTLRDLNYRSELARIEQFRKNISTGISWQNSYDSTLADVKDFVSAAKEIAVAMANGTYDDVARAASSRDVKSMIEQLEQLANVDLDGRRIFAGFKTTRKPFEMSANGFTYLGDRGDIEFEVETGQRMVINQDGVEAFLQQIAVLGEGSDANVGVVGSTTLASLHNGDGIDLGSITITDRNDDSLAPVTVDLSGAVTVDDVVTTINNALSAGGMTNITARLGDENNNITFDTTDNGIISASTSLSKLNQGAGVTLDDGRFRVTDGAGTSVVVDIGGAGTIGEVITAFNSQLAAAGVNNVTMGINAAGTGLAITDSNGTPLGLHIEEMTSTDKTAGDLGILGQIDPQLDGRALDPITHFEITETTGTTAEDLGIGGEFSRVRVGDDLDPQLLATDLLSSLGNGTGLGDGEILLHQGGWTHRIDLTDPSLNTVQDLLDEFNNSGLRITASINADGRGIQVVNDDETRSFVIEDSDEAEAAKRLGIFGSSDTLGTMIALRNALERDDQKGTGMLLENFDDSILSLLNNRADIGARAIRLETTDSRHVDAQLNFTKSLSEVEDADITELVTKLATQENNYRASMISASKIIQPSLLDFLSR